MVVSDLEKALGEGCQVCFEKMSASEPLMMHRKESKMLSKPGSPSSPGTSLKETCLLFRRQPVYRWHDLETGFGMERGNLAFDVKGNDKWQTPQGRIPMQKSGAEPLVVA